MKPYVDIHTHLKKELPDHVSVRSLSFEELRDEVLSLENCCIGIHPWWTEDLSEREIHSLKEGILSILENKKVWAIGETGIDRLIPETLEQQKSLFKWHFDLAQKYGLPLVIHNVRAGSDFLHFMKEHHPQTPWIFHDFRGNETLLKDLLRLHPDCYFSFGLSLDNSPQVRELLPKVPLERLFLETDNQKHLDIHDIYLRAASILNFDVAALRSVIWENFHKFSPSLH